MIWEGYGKELCSSWKYYAEIAWMDWIKPPLRVAVFLAEIRTDTSQMQARSLTAWTVLFGKSDNRTFYYYCCSFVVITILRRVCETCAFYINHNLAGRFYGMHHYWYFCRSTFQRCFCFDAESGGAAPQGGGRACQVLRQRQYQQRREQYGRQDVPDQNAADGAKWARKQDQQRPSTRGQ